MRVLVIYAEDGASSNSAAQRIADGFEKNSFDCCVLPLSQLCLPPCTRCGKCMKTGENDCPHRAGVAEAERKIAENDGLVIVSPVIFSQICSQTQTFLEHLEYKTQRPTFIGKVGCAAVCAQKHSNMRAPAAAMREVMMRWGFSRAGRLKIKYGKPYMVKCDSMVKTMCRMLEKKDRPPSLRRVFNFNLRRAFMTLNPASPPDSLYWRATGLYTRTFHPGANTSRIKSQFGNLVFKLARILLFKTKY